ncbi:MAG: iron-sulfur cluster assembly scaffold protein [Clostridia bacterium]|nr:iron-sulfur cluster assembly scaffold protein [Clostridia bacterium]
MYNEIVIDHFNNPRNVGELKGCNGIGTSKSKEYGDVVKLFLKVNTNVVIEEASFKTVGNVATIAISSALTEKLVGLTVDKATKLTAADLCELVGGLPEGKKYSAIIVKEAVDDAVKNYRKRLMKGAGLHKTILKPELITKIANMKKKK